MTTGKTNDRPSFQTMTIPYHRLASFQFITFLIAGFIVAYFFDLNAYYFLELILAGICLLLSTGLHFCSYSSHSSKKKIFYQVQNYSSTILLYVSIFLAAILYFQLRHQNKASDHLSLNQKNIAAVYGTIINYPKYKTKQYRFYRCKNQRLNWPAKQTEYKLEVHLVRFQDSSSFQQSSGHILIKHKNWIKHIQRGDKVLIRGRFYRVKQKQSCSNINYVNYLHRQDIYYILSSYQYSQAHVIQASTSTFNQISSTIRNYIQKIYKSKFSPNEIALLEGMLIGSREKIDSKLNEALQKSGVKHLLAVSGLHVGLVAYFLFFVLSSLRINKKWTLILINLILFLYLDITGNNIPTVRATIMFTCGTIVYLLDRDKNYINILFLTAIFILMYQPNLFLDIGFQLSFLATFGILRYMKPIYECIIRYTHLSNKSKSLSKHSIFQRMGHLLKEMIQKSLLLLSLTMSVQILTIPLSILYFGGYSLISIFSNLWIIIIAEIVIALGFFMPILSLVCYPLFEIYYHSLSLSLNILNKLIFFFADLPYSYIQIPFHGIILIFYYVVVFWISKIVESKN